MKGGLVYKNKSNIQHYSYREIKLMYDYEALEKNS